MISASLDPLLRFVARLAPRSVVARTTAVIFSLALVLGLAFALASARIVHRHEYENLQTQLQQLVDTVDTTAQIATYLKNRELAREIAAGLMKNDIVGGVRIMASGSTLYQVMRPRAARGAERLDEIERPIHSPFNASATVGTMTLYLSHSQLRDRAWTYTRYILWILAAEVAAISAGTALVVFLVVTLPIKRISEELHRLRGIETPMLRMPAGNEADEIGSLVMDVNALIHCLNQLISNERTLRIQREVSERKLRLVLEQTELGICIMDDQGALQSWNPAFVRLLALAEEPAEGTPLAQQTPLAAHAGRIDDMLRSCVLDCQPCEADFEVRLETAATANWIELSVNPIGTQLVLGIVQDITERKRSVARAQQLAMRDPLTGLLNRRGLDAMLAKLFSEGVLPRSLAVLAIDLDRFKQINDTMGHEAGDKVLRHVGGVIEATVRGGDIVGRIGGDEFVALLIGEGHVLRAADIAADIITRLNTPIELERTTAVTAGASIGIAQYCGPDDDPAALLRRADAAMYASKRAGRGRVSVAPEAAA